MASFEITGGKPLIGTVRVSGAKNEALKVIPMAVLLEQPVKITNVPDIVDVRNQIKIIEDLGAQVSFDNDVLFVDPTGINTPDISEKAKKLRASIVFIGPVLARFKKVSCPHPGGCIIGVRPIDTHTDAFRQLGAQIEEDEENLKISLEVTEEKNIGLIEQSVSATENLILFASGSNFPITINNCAIEPEVLDLIRIVESAGAKVERLSERSFKISRGESFSASEIEIMPDRIEAGTFAIAMLATGGHGEILNIRKDDLLSFTDLLKKTGVQFTLEDNRMEIKETKSFEPFELVTAPHPGFPTDLQSPMALIAAKADGKSRIHEALYENRLQYLKELQEMGLEVEFESNKIAYITGPTVFKPTEIQSLDLRSGITLVIAALMTDGQTIIKDVEIIDRGYENLEEKIKKLGGQIKRIGTDGTKTDRG